MRKEKKQFKFLVLFIVLIFLLSGCFHNTVQKEDVVETNINAPAEIEEEKVATSTTDEEMEIIGETEGEVEPEPKKEVDLPVDGEKEPEEEVEIEKEPEPEEEIETENESEKELELEPEEEAEMEVDGVDGTGESKEDEGVTTTIKIDTDNFFTLEEVAKHNSESDCWFVINGKVYDVTNFISSHPGGRAILEGCGKDATVLFETRPMGSGTPHSNNARTIRENYYIGDLK